MGRIATASRAPRKQLRATIMVYQGQMSYDLDVTYKHIPGWGTSECVQSTNPQRLWNANNRYSKGAYLYSTNDDYDITAGPIKLSGCPSTKIPLATATMSTTGKK